MKMDLQLIIHEENNILCAWFKIFIVFISQSNYVNRFLKKINNLIICWWWHSKFNLGSMEGKSVGCWFQFMFMLLT